MQKQKIKILQILGSLHSSWMCLFYAHTLLYWSHSFKSLCSKGDTHSGGFSGNLRFQVYLPRAEILYTGNMIYGIRQTRDKSEFYVVSSLLFFHYWSRFVLLLPVIIMSFKTPFLSMLGMLILVVAILQSSYLSLIFTDSFHGLWILAFCEKQ